MVSDIYHIPGQVWHITYRCYKQEFLFKFSCDRKDGYSGCLRQKSAMG